MKHAFVVDGIRARGHRGVELPVDGERTPVGRAAPRDRAISAAIAFLNHYFPWIALPLVTVGIALAVRREAPAFSQLEWRSVWQAILPAALAFSVAPLAQAFSFWLVLRFLGARAPFAETMRVWAHSYVLRYAPSGALAVLCRLRAKARLRATRDQILTAEAYEHLGALAAGAAACLIAFALLGTLPPRLGLAIAPPVLLLAITLHPTLLGRVAQRCLCRMRINASLLGGRQLLLVVGVNLVAWASTGVGMVLVANDVTEIPGRGVRWAVGTYTVAYLVGFVTPLLPGGLGAREAVLVVLLAPSYGLGNATAIALALRVAVSVGELLAVGVLLVVKPAVLRGARLPRARGSAAACHDLGGERRGQVGGAWVGRRQLEPAPDRSGAEGAGLPQRVEGGRALAAGRLQLRGADGADEERRLDARPTDRALGLRLHQVPLERPKLDAPRFHIGERLGRPEEQVGEWAGERHEPQERGGPGDPGILDPAACVAVHPEGDPEPQEGDEEQRQVARDLERSRMKDGVERPHHCDTTLPAGHTKKTRLRKRRGHLQAGPDVQLLSGSACGATLVDPCDDERPRDLRLPRVRRGRARRNRPVDPRRPAERRRRGRVERSPARRQRRRLWRRRARAHARTALAFRT